MAYSKTWEEMQLTWVLREQNQEQTVHVHGLSIGQAWVYDRSKRSRDPNLAGDPIRNTAEVYSYETYTYNRKATGRSDAEMFR